jgi:hypothetical protein
VLTRLAQEALTPVEAEVLEEVGLTGAQSRRQVMVGGTGVNDLVGERFGVGDVECAGVDPRVADAAFTPPAG